MAVAFSSEHSLLGDYEVSQMFTNMNPNDLPLWPALFITIACGAISGFHATQSPLMACCMENEKNGRFIFYCAMIGVIGLKGDAHGNTIGADFCFAN